MRQRPKPPARPERGTRAPHRAAAPGKTRGAPERRTRTGRERWMSAKLENGSVDAARLPPFPEWAALAPPLAVLGISPQDALPKLPAYAALILTWNRSVSTS